MSLWPFTMIDFSMLPDTPTGFHKLLLSVLIYTMLSLWSIIAILGHLVALHIVHNTQWETKYPKIKPLINYFKTTNYIYLAIEVIILISMYVFIIGVCIKILYFD